MRSRQVRRVEATPRPERSAILIDRAIQQMNRSAVRARLARAAVAVPLLSFPAAGCGSAGASDAAAAGEPFDRVFVATEEVRLQPPADDPIGSVSAVEVWNDSWIVVDALQSNAKRFSPSGAWVSTIGRAGDGPGEFRTPLSAVAVSESRLLLYDIEGRVAFFDPAGEYVSGWRMSPGNPTGLSLSADGGELIVGGRKTSDEPDHSGERLFGVHRYSIDGAYLESFGRLPQPAHYAEASFFGTSAALVGNTVISAQQSRNHVHLRDLTTGREWTDTVGAAIYRAPDWSVVTGRGYGDLTRMTAAGMWLMRLVALDCSRYAAGFRITRDGEHFWQWVVRDLDGSELAATAPTRVRLASARDGRIHATRMDEDGNVDLLVLRLGDDLPPPACGPEERA
jgi:hypothetical protein